MAESRTVVMWNRDGAASTDNRYSRGHRWLSMAAWRCPISFLYVVPVPWSIAAAVVPEEAFVASLSSCHLLWFLSIASKIAFVVESYRDEAVGVMGKDAFPVRRPVLAAE